MSAEQKEIVGRAYLLNTQQRANDSGHLLFRGCAEQNVGGIAQGVGGVGSGQGRAVYFAIRGQGQRFHFHEYRGNHVLWQAGFQKLTQNAGCRSGGGRRD